LYPSSIGHELKRVALSIDGFQKIIELGVQGWLAAGKQKMGLCTYGFELRQ
jgi:hypothetical protein